jgi:hypothetical protein
MLVAQRWIRPTPSLRRPAALAWGNKVSVVTTRSWPRRRLGRRQGRRGEAQWRLDQKQVRAPSEAFVFDTLFRVGEYVATGQPVLSLLPRRISRFASSFPSPACRPSSPATDRGSSFRRRLFRCQNLYFFRGRVLPPPNFPIGTTERNFFTWSRRFQKRDQESFIPGSPSMCFWDAQASR